MKKYFKMFVFVCLFSLLPFSASAILRVDDQGNAIDNFTGDGEVSIMDKEIFEVDSSAPTSSNPDERTTTDVGQEYIDNYDNEGEDLLFTTQDNMETLSTTALDGSKKDYNLLFIAISGLSGIAMGGIGTYFVLSKK